MDVTPSRDSSGIGVNLKQLLDTGDFVPSQHTTAHGEEADRDSQPFFFVNVWAVEHRQFSRPGWSVAVLQCVWEDALCVVRRCALTRGDPRGSRTQSSGLVRHPPPERQQFTRSFIQSLSSRTSPSCVERNPAATKSKVLRSPWNIELKVYVITQIEFRKYDTVDVFVSRQKVSPSSHPECKLLPLAVTSGNFYLQRYFGAVQWISKFTVWLTSLKCNLSNNQ